MCSKLNKMKHKNAADLIRVQGEWLRRDHAMLWHVSNCHKCKDEASK